MIEPIESPPAEPPASSGRGRRWPRVVAILVGALVVLGAVGFLATGAIQSRTFDQLVGATRTAEGAEVWKTFFIAQDCFIDSVVEVADPDLAFNEGLALREQTEFLARHVSTSLATFSDLSVLPFHRSLIAARDSIVAHYRVWDGHLANASAVLSGLDADPTALAIQFQAWVEVVVSDSEPIASTFADAETAFEMAARDDQARQAIANLFTPSEVECSRGAV